MEKMFGYPYVQGYTAALQDVLSTIGKDMEEDLKRHKRRQNLKTVRAIVECMLKNRAIFREEPYAFVRCNDEADGGFEVYISGQGVYDPDQGCDV